MTNQPITYQRQIIGVEVKLGFIYVPAQAREHLPDETAKVAVKLPNQPKPVQITDSVS